MSSPSPDATWRVYLTEWLVVYTSDASGGLEGGEECFRHFRDKYKGRVRDEDVRVVPAVAGAEREQHRPYCLQLRLPNLRGEFKDCDDAVALAGDVMDEYPAPLVRHQGPCDVVQRGSAEEQKLLDYGKKMLPDGG